MPYAVEVHGSHWLADLVGAVEHATLAEAERAADRVRAAGGRPRIVRVDGDGKRAAKVMMTGARRRHEAKPFV